MVVVDKILLLTLWYFVNIWAKTNENAFMGFLWEGGEDGLNSRIVLMERNEKFIFVLFNFKLKFA
jgi:hypothetical protein